MTDSMRLFKTWGARHEWEQSNLIIVIFLPH
jgi:hypothetical protein